MIQLFAREVMPHFRDDADVDNPQAQGGSTDKAGGEIAIVTGAKLQRMSHNTLHTLKEEEPA